MQMMQGGNPLMSMMGGQQGKNHKKAANTLCEMAKQELEHAKELYEMFEEAKAVKAFKEHEEVVKYIGEELHEEIEEWGI